MYHRPPRYIATSPAAPASAGPASTVNRSRSAARNASGVTAAEVVHHAVVGQDLHLVVGKGHGQERRRPHSPGRRCARPQLLGARARRSPRDGGRRRCRAPGSPRTPRPAASLVGAVDAARSCARTPSGAVKSKSGGAAVAALDDADRRRRRARRSGTPDRSARELEHVPRAIVLLVAARPLVLLDEVAVVLVDREARRHAGLDVRAHLQAVDIEARRVLDDERRLGLSVCEVLGGLGVDRVGVGIVSPAADRSPRATRAESSAGCRRPARGLVGVDDVVGNGGHARRAERASAEAHGTEQAQPWSRIILIRSRFGIDHQQIAITAVGGIHGTFAHLTSAGVCLPRARLFSSLVRVAPGRTRRASRATIQGTVVDQSGAVLPGVTVTVTNTATGVDTRDGHRRGRDVSPRRGAAGRPVRSDRGAHGLRARDSQENLRVHDRRDERRCGSSWAWRRSPTRSRSARTAPVLETTRTQVSSTSTKPRSRNLPGQRPQLHRLRAADARRDARRAQRRHQLRRPARHAEQPGRGRRRQQQHVLRPDARPHGIGPRAVSVQRRRRCRSSRSTPTPTRPSTAAPAARSSTSSPSRAPTRLTGSVFEFYRDKALNANNADQRAARPRRSRPITTTSSAACSAGRSGATATSSSSTTTGSATRSRTSCSSTCRPTRPATPTRSRRSRGCSRSRRSWDQTQNQDVFLVKTDHQLTPAEPADAALQPSELHRQELRERRPADRVRAHRRLEGLHAHVQRDACTSVLGVSLFNEVARAVGEGSGAGRGQQRRTRGDRPAGRHDRAHASAATTSAPARRRSSAGRSPTR